MPRQGILRARNSHCVREQSARASLSRLLALSLAAATLCSRSHRGETTMPQTASKKKKSLYSVHPGVAMVQKWIADLPAKTGRTFEQWLSHIRKNGPQDDKACVQWLKTEHGMGSNTAWWLAERAANKPAGFADDSPESYLNAAPGYVDKMFAGPKAALRPLYDKLLDVCLNFADDVKACPCQTI